MELKARPVILDKLRAQFPQWAEKLGADHLLPLDTLKAIGGSALTDAMKIEMGRDGLPTTFVPGRNVMFLTAAAALGYRRGIIRKDLFPRLEADVLSIDFSGWPIFVRADLADAAMQKLTVWAGA